MRKVSKILCVVLALVVAFSAASCSLTKQYSYKTDDVELPIGVYIYYLRAAYSEAQTLAQKSDKYDAEAGTYDGEKSFLKMEITDDDGKTAVAEDWIMDKTEEYMNNVVAVYYEYNKLGATMDETQHDEYRSYYKEYWDNGVQNYYAPFKETYEPYGIGFDSFFIAEVTLNLMSDAVFKAEYADVTDDELHKFYEDNYTAYHYFSANLYTTTTDSETGESVTAALSDDMINEYTSNFTAYADAVNGGEKFSDILDRYNSEYEASATATDKTEKLDPETEDEIEKAVLGLKEGEAKQVVIGDDEQSRKIYLIYKEPIADTTESYFTEAEGSTSQRDDVLSVMKKDEYKDLLKAIAAAIDIDKSSACKDYKPSMFE